MSCCTCNCNPCQCAPEACCPENEVLTYTFENQNLIGIGVWNNETDRLVGFNGVASGSNSITVSFDSANRAIVISLDVDVIVDDLPDATESQRGVLETASNAEAVAKAATDKILVPANLAALGASTTFSGFIEIATNAEALAGAATGLAIVPSSLASVLATKRFTTVAADAVARAALVPSFLGQILVQLDLTEIYVANALVAGGWTGNITIPGVLQVNGVANLNGSAVNVPNDLTVLGTLQADGTSTFNGLINSGGDAAFLGGFFNLDVSDFRISGVTVPAASVLGTAGLGVANSRLLSTFISTANTQTGYTAVTNGATIRTYDCNTVTLPQLAQALGTLMADLKAVKLPAV